MKTSLWVLSKHWDYEGGDVVGIFSTKEKAIEAGETWIHSSADSVLIDEMILDDPDFKGETITIK